MHLTYLYKFCAQNYCSTNHNFIKRHVISVKMALLRILTKGITQLPKNNIKFDKVNGVCAACVRLLNYTPKEYDEKNDPAPLFFNKEVQSLLKMVTRIDLNQVFKKRKLGTRTLADPEYKFMTDAELQEAFEKANKKVDELIQIPPVLAVHKPANKVYSRNPELQGLETSRMVFTDITFGIKDTDRLIVVREPDGTLRDAEWELRNRVNQVYFPRDGRHIKPPKMFEDNYLEDLLNRKEYEFILDAACIQFEPNEKDYQRVTSITYQHLNDNNDFESLRSTRHFGSLAFFLVWNKNIDNLLLDLLETLHIEEVNNLLKLYSKIHNIQFESDGNLKSLQQYIERESTKRGALELAVQAYQDVLLQKEKLESGIKAAHGLN